MHDVIAALVWLQHHSVVFMFTVFSLLLATVFWPGRSARFERDARIPLDDDR
jgi:cbb3-type cytochrome oxidase subunit 3